MGRRPTKEDLTRKIRELEQENRDLRGAVEDRDEKHWRILDSIDEGYYELDLKGNIVSFNQAAGSLLGYEPHGILGMSYRNYTSQETAHRMYEVFHRIYETGNPERLVDYEVISRDGSIRTHEMSAGLRRDKSGKAVGFNVLVHDVTARNQAEVFLKESEERYRSILESMEEAYFELDLKGTYTFANTAVHRMLGYDPSEIVGLNYRSYLSPETAKRMFDVFSRIYRTGEPQHLVDYEVILKDGSIRVHEMNAAPLRDASGNIVGFRGVGRDVTDRKQAEVNLRRSEERYRSILESMEEAYYEVDLKGNFTFFNSRAVNRLGYTIEELSGMNYRRYMDEESARKVFDAYHQVFLTGEPVSGFAWELKNKQGQPIFVEASISLRRNGEGMPVGFFGVVRDITERKKAEESLRTSEQKYRGILESMQESYFEVDLKGNFTFLNDAATRMSGYSREELKGMNYRQYSPPETARRLFEVFHRVYMTGNPELIVDYEIIHKDGALRDNEMSVWPMRDASGTIVGFHSLVRDVTERKRSERAISQSEERYRTIFENTGSSSILIGKDTTILLANSNFEKLTGYSKEEMEGKMSWTAFVDEADLERMKGYHAQRRVDPSTVPQSYEFRLRRRSGEIRDIYITIVIMPGTMESVASCVDITERKKAEEALRQSEARYRFLTENMGDMAFTVDLDMRTTYVSPSVEKLLGFTVEERKLQRPEHQLTPASYAHAVEILARELERDREEGIDPNRSVMMELEYYHKDGTIRYLETNFSAVRDAGGNVIGIHGISRDVTERKKAEEALRQSEERWQFALEGAGDGVWDYDVEQGRIYRSPRWKEMLGYDENEISDSPDEWSRLVHPDDLQLVDEDLNRHFRGETPVYIHEHRIRCRDGSYKWILDRGKVISWSEDGRPLRIIGTQADITERKQAEAALKQSEERYRTILETMDEAYFELDLRGDYIYVNDAHCRIMGYTREELLGMNNREYTSPETAKRAYRTFTEILRTETAQTMTDYEVVRKDGRKIIAEFSASIMRGLSGEVVGFRGVGRDVTERIRAEKALKESERKYRLLAENLRDVIWVLDADLKYVYVSPSVMQLRGYTPEEAMRQTMDQVLAPESYRNAVELFTRERAFEFGGRKHGRDWTMNLDLEMIRKDGSTVWTEVTLNILYDGHGEPEGLLGITHDISDRRKAEEAIRESEERYRTLFDGMTDGVYRSTHDGRFVNINQAMVDMFGYGSKEDMMQADIVRDLYFSPEDRDSQAEQAGLEEREIHRMRRRDGSEIWVEDHGRYVHDEQGHVLFHEGTLRDVTERKKAEEALRRSEERYRAIFENTATANIIVAEDTTILLANSNFEKLTGYSREEVENKMSWTAFVVEEDLEIMKQRHMQRRTDPGSVVNAYEFKARVRSGELRNLYMSVSMIPETRESVASLIDLTDRRKAEDALRQSEERFRDLARLLPETVFETDLNGKFTFVNEISLERFGFTREDVEQGVSVLDVMAPHDHERVIAHYLRVMQGERLGLSEYTALKKDGTAFPALIHTTPIYRDGGYVGLRGFLIDVTEKKNLEEQLMRAQKLEAIGTLAGGIAHDFNNLLMGILGNISLMLMRFDESHPFHDRLKSMEEYVQRGSDLTKQLLGFARGGKYEVKPTDLGEFVRRSAEMFGRTKKEIRMHHKASEDLWAVEVDRGQMEQVMLNLFVNAWQAMPGGGDLYLSVENAELNTDDVSPYGIGPGRFIKITVTDTGVGMDEATKARIFEPFFSTKERGRGTGLGLASVYGIIKNHGGFILVESEKDIGTSFMVYLPVSEKSIEHENRSPERFHKGRETVLVIDDEEMIVEVSARMLESLGYKVLTATGGRQGLQIFDQNRGAIDLVILDMIMPDIGGRETFDALRRQKPDVKVLLSSGYSLDGQAKEILAEGCRGFIQKPFTMAELSKRIRQILEEG